jgi:predicted transcriptional regulator
MAAQCRHLIEVASTAHVIVQVLPAIAHPVNASGFLMADDAVWIEHAASGYVFTDEETISSMGHRFDILRAESYRASESLVLLEEIQDRWATGVSPLTAMRTVATA